MSSGVLVPGKGTIPLIASYLPNAPCHYLKILISITVMIPVMMEIWLYEYDSNILRSSNWWLGFLLCSESAVTSTKNRGTADTHPSQNMITYQHIHWKVVLLQSFMICVFLHLEEGCLRRKTEIRVGGLRLIGSIVGRA